jgi:hypothetical protein
MKKVKNKVGELTVWWCRAASSRLRLLLGRTAVGRSAFVVVPTRYATLLIAAARTIPPLCVAPATMALVFALPELDRSRRGASVGRFDVTV